jgi:hypothetical protein
VQLRFGSQACGNRSLRINHRNANFPGFYPLGLLSRLFESLAMWGGVTAIPVRASPMRTPDQVRHKKRDHIIEIIDFNKVTLFSVSLLFAVFS